MIYRGTLSLHEDDQLFLGDSEAHLAKEQQQLMARLTRLNPVVRLLGIASGFLILVDRHAVDMARIEPHVGSPRTRGSGLRRFPPFVKDQRIGPLDVAHAHATVSLQKSQQRSRR